MGRAVKRPAKRQGGPRTVATQEVDERAQANERALLLAEENNRKNEERIRALEAELQSIKAAQSGASQLVTSTLV